MRMRYLPLPTCALALAVSIAAQSKDPKQLEHLLKQLGTLDRAAWQARLAQLASQATAEERRAKSLQSQAELALRRARAVRQEIERVQKLMALVQPKPSPRAAVVKNPKPKAPARKPSPMKPTSPTKKPSTNKSAAKKSAAKKPATKKPTTKKPPAKKPPAAKQPGPKQPAAMPSAQTPAAENWVTYDDHVQEIFMENCSACHDSDEREGGLDLTSFATARAGGSSGTTIVPGDTDRSRLYQLVAHLQKPTMPLDEPPIDKAKIELIRQWIAAGAPESKTDAAAFAASRSRARPKAAPMQASFDKPAPLPKGWAAVKAARPLRPVGIKTLAGSPRSPLLAVPGLRQVHVVDTAKHQVLGTVPFEYGDVEVLAFSADASRLLVAGGAPGKKGRAVLYDVANGKVVGTYGKEFDSVIAAAVHPQLSHVAIGGSSRRVRVFRTSDGKLDYEIKDHNEWVLGIDFSRDGKYLASVDRMGTIVVTEAKSGRNLHVIRRHRGAVHQVRFAPDGRTFATVGSDRTLRLFDARNGRQIIQRGTGARPLSVAFRPDGKMIACGCDDRRVRLFRSNGAPLATLQKVSDWVYSVAFSSDNKRVYAGDFRGATTVFDIKTRRKVGEVVTANGSPTKARRISRSSK